MPHADSQHARRSFRLDGLPGLPGGGDPTWHRGGSCPPETRQLPRSNRARQLWKARMLWKGATLCAWDAA